MRLLVTCPGRAGDILWALPSIRALSRRISQPVDLTIAGEFGNLIPLLQRQEYLQDVVADPRWNMSAGWQAPTPYLGLQDGGPGGEPYDQVIELGYRRWPEIALPFETLHTLNQQWAQIPFSLDTTDRPFTFEDLALTEPWITNLPQAPPTEIAVGFSECHFELKVGLVTLLDMDTPMLVLTHDSRTRWYSERPRGGYPVKVTPWLEEAGIIRNANVFLGCNSGLHVLAVAVGTPVVMYEPMEARHNPIFFPLGMDGPQVTVVRGLDGQPTTDSRHTREVVEQVRERKGTDDRS